MKSYLRMFQTTLATLAIVCLVATASWGEEKAKKQPAFKQNRLPAVGKRMFSTFWGRSFIKFVSQPQIQTELKVTETQKTDIQEIATEHNAKYRDLYKGIGAIKNKGERPNTFFKEMNRKHQALIKETDAKVNKVLDDAQQKRIQQILLQGVSGYAIFTQKRVVKELEITEDQLTKIKEVFGSQRKKVYSIMKEMREGKIERGDMGKKFKELRKSIETDANNVLTKEQQKKLQELKGEKFEWKRVPHVQLNRPSVKVKKIKIRKAIPAQVAPKKNEN